MSNNNVIIWEKWLDPFGSDEEFCERNERYEDDLDYNEDSSLYQKLITQNKYPIIATPFGIIPITESTSSSKIFNFWTGHTNFSITRKVSNIIEHTEGVETLSVFTRYRFRISVGKAFKDSDVMTKINNNIYYYLENKDVF
jgi:hypothetical protein